MAEYRIEELNGGFTIQVKVNTTTKVGFFQLKKKKISFWSDLSVYNNSTYQEVTLTGRIPTSLRVFKSLKEAKEYIGKFLTEEIDLVPGVDEPIYHNVQHDSTS